jgi:3-hydroxymyristoyl/3-hydroxydecanoyl-(acyl carrier protein) dehydratase
VVEAWNPVTQTAKGWTKNSFKPGDEVVADVTPAKNSRNVGEFRGRIEVNGKVLQEGR